MQAYVGNITITVKHDADRIDQAKQAGELTPEEEEKLYRELARDYPVLTSGTRLHRIAADFVAHYSQRRKTGKAVRRKG